MMKLSFILASYNEAEYLPQAVESCRELGLSDYEILIGDDGSDDGSIQYIQNCALADPEHVRFFVQDRSDTSDLIASLRVSDLLFKAMEAAGGEYLCILSGDDWFYKSDFFRQGISFLDANPDYSAFVGSYDKVWSSRPAQQETMQYPREIYWAGAYTHISAFLFRASAVPRYRLDRFCDDTGLSYSLACAGKWKYTQTPVFAYRQRESSITHVSDALQLSIAELMLMQDALNKGNRKYQTLARFAKPARYVFDHRDMAMLEKYRKYRENCAQYPQDILGDILAYDEAGREEKRRLERLLLQMRLCRLLFGSCLRLWGLGQKIKKILAK